MGKRSFQFVLYAIAVLVVLLGMSMLVFELRSGLHISPTLAPVLATSSIITAISLIVRAHSG